MSSKTEILVHRNFRVMATLTLIVSIIWTGLAIYTATTETPEDAVKAEITKPIDTNLDIEALQIISKKRQITETLKDPSVLQTTIVSPSPNAASRKSSSASINQIEVVETINSTPSASTSAADSAL